MMKDPVVGVVLPNDPHAAAQPNVYTATPAPYGTAATNATTAPTMMTAIDGVALYEFPDCESSCASSESAGVPPPAAQTTVGRLKSMFRVKGYQDVPAALAFGAHLVGVIATAAYTMSHYDDYVKRLSVVSDRVTANSNANFATTTNGAIGQGWPSASGLVGALVLGVGAIGLALLTLKRNAYAAVVAGQILCLGLFFLSALMLLASGSPFGILFIVLGLLAAVGIYRMRARMRLAAVLLSNAVRITTTNWGTLVVAMGSVCALFVYLLIWVAALVVPVTPILEASSIGVTAPGGASAALFFLTIAVYWTSAVSHYVAHVTSSGVAATWYFAGAQLMPPKASSASLKRAMTTSFGSICLGGLVLAIVRVLCAVVRAQTENSNEIVRCFARCLMDMLERAVQYFNLYAFTHVAIYGDSYVAAASRTWAFMKDSWLQALWNDCFVSDALMLVSFGITMLIGLALALTGASAGTVAFAVVFTLGAAQIVFGVLTSTVVTLFVCLAQEPQAIHLNNHVFAQELSAALTGCGVQTQGLESSYTV